MWTGSSPAVRSPTAAAAASGSIVRATGSMSQKTGVAPSYSRQFEEATKLSGVVTTSSPSPQPRARTPRWRAAVPLETATAKPSPSQVAKPCSNCSSFGPRESEPERTTSRSSCSSRGPRSGCASGICSFTRRAGLGTRLEGVLERVHQRLPGGLDDVLGDADGAPLPLAIRGIEQDPGHRARPVVLVEDPHFVVRQLDVGQMRMPVEDRAAERLVERVHRTVALGRPEVALTVDPDLDRG